MLTYTFEEAQSIYHGIDRAELIAQAQTVAPNVKEGARIWFEENEQGTVTAWVAREEDDATR